MTKIILVISILFLTGCFDDDDNQKTAQNSIQLGKEVFDKNCISCHGKAARGTVKNWKQMLPNGKYPAPPLNGTAHAWHHSPQLLLNTLNNGGVRLGGWMPGFKNKLTETEKQAVIDYIYSLWPKEIQQKYEKRFK